MGSIPALNAFALGIDRNTLEDGFSYGDYLNARNDVKEVDPGYGGRCLYKLRNDPTVAPTTISGTQRPSATPTTRVPSSLPTSAPTESEKIVVVASQMQLKGIDASGRASINTAGSSERRACLDGIVASVEALTSTDSINYLEASLVVTEDRRLLEDQRRLEDSSGNTALDFTMEIYTGTNDAAAAAALISSITATVAADLTANVVDSDTFVNAMVASLAASGASSSSLASAAVDVNATRTAITTLTTGFVQTASPTLLPQASSSSSSSGSDTLIIIIICAVGGAVLIAGAAGAFFITQQKKRSDAYGAPTKVGVDG